ncbi:MAG: hypothetical protein ABFS46_10535 [Myxococcota bacterium]
MAPPEAALQRAPDPRRHWYAALPPLLVILLYARSVHFDYVWDDWVLVPIHAYTSFDLVSILTSPGNEVHYLPVRDLTLLLDTWLFGSWPGGFHLTNVIVFAIAGWLSYRVYLALFSAESRSEGGAAALALVCALIFVAHPLQVEPVSFVSSRNGLLALTFVLASWLAYGRFLEGRGAGAYALSLLFTAAALLSKQSAVSLPLLLLLLHLYRRKDEGWLHAVRPLLPHFLLAAGLGMLHAGIARSVGVVGGEVTPLGLLERLPRAAFVSEFYVWKFLWPTELSIEYPLGGYLGHRGLLAASTLLMGAAFVLVVARGWRARSLSWLLAWSYLAGLLPVMNLLPTHPTVADRYAQLPLIALTPLLVAPCLTRLPVWPRYLTSAVLVIALSTASFSQSSVWRNDETLFRHALSVAPGASHALGNLGTMLWDDGRHEEALRVLAQYHELDPADFRYHYALGLRALEKGDLEQARVWLESASTRRGDFLFLVHMKLGELHLREDRREEARRSFEQALELARGRRQAREHQRVIERNLGLLGGG